MTGKKLLLGGVLFASAVGFGIRGTPELTRVESVKSKSETEGPPIGEGMLMTAEILRGCAFCCWVGNFGF